MSTLTKTRRMPAKYCVRPGGVTEIIYKATPDVIVVLPGTRWLEVRRAREARLAVACEEMVTPEPVMGRTLTFRCEVSEPAAGTAAATTDPEEPNFAEEQAEPLSWTEQMRIVTTRLIRRQSQWFSSMRGESNVLAPSES